MLTVQELNLLIDAVSTHEAALNLTPDQLKQRVIACVPHEAVSQDVIDRAVKHEVDKLATVIRTSRERLCLLKAKLIGMRDSNAADGFLNSATNTKPESE